MPILWFTTIQIQNQNQWLIFFVGYDHVVSKWSYGTIRSGFFLRTCVYAEVQKSSQCIIRLILVILLFRLESIFFSWSLFRWRSILIRVFVDIELSTKKAILIDLKNKTIENLLSVSKYHWILVCCCFCGCSIVIAHFIDRCQALLSRKKNNIDLRFYRNLCHW